MLTCSRPLIERRLRPPHDQALKCPRCDSTHTKFCYYNNYSLSQPRYFCKTCRRYWTKGGTLRNIPVGGGCRKNKKVAAAAAANAASSKKSTDLHSNNTPPPNSTHHNPTDLHLSSFPPEVQFSHLSNFLGTHGLIMESKYGGMLENARPVVDFMEGSSRINHDFIGNCEVVGMGGIHADMISQNFHGLCSQSPFDANAGAFMDTCQRIMLPYEGNLEQNGIDVKPNPKLLSLDWQDQGNVYLNSLGSWNNGMVTSGYGPSSTTNPLV